jgi:U2-associated protein SR140
VDDDLDGKPLDDDLGEDFDGRGGQSGAFVPSRWETVDPELIEAQAMTTSKWELLEQQQQQQVVKKPSSQLQQQQQQQLQQIVLEDTPKEDPDDSIDSW